MTAMASRSALSFVALAISASLFCNVAAVSNDLDTTAPTEVNREGRDYSSYSSYFPDDDKAKFGSGGYDYPPSYVSYPKDEIPANCPPSSLGPALNSGLNFLILKLGAIGIIKAVVAVAFFVALLKLPILLAKAAFFKAIILPAVIAPLMMLFSNSNMMGMMMKPGGNGMNGGNGGSGGSGGNGNNGNGGDNGRAFDQLSDTAWQSFRFVLDSDKCAERLACQFGSYNNDTVSGETLARMMKHIEHSSPAGTRGRLRSLRAAFIEGNSGRLCEGENFPCQAPHLIVSRGDSNFTVI